MADEIKESGWFVPDELSEEDRKELGLDGSELSRLAMAAQSPELSDPLLFFLPQRGRKVQDRRGWLR